MDFSKPDSKQLLESLLSDAVGLSLHSEIKHSIPPKPGACNDQGQPDAMAAWLSDCGTVWGSVTYQPKHSAKLRAHVRWLEWTLGKETHSGFYYCYPSRPPEWIVGFSGE